MNVLKPDKKSTIMTLLKNDVGQREIHRKTNIDRKTIRKYAKESGFLSEVSDKIQNPPPRPPVNSPSKEEKRTIPLHARSACEPHRLQFKMVCLLFALFLPIILRSSMTP